MLVAVDPFKPVLQCRVQDERWQPEDSSVTFKDRMFSSPTSPSSGEVEKKSVSGDNRSWASRPKKFPGRQACF